MLRDVLWEARNIEAAIWVTASPSLLLAGDHTALYRSFSGDITRRHSAVSTPLLLLAPTSLPMPACLQPPFRDPEIAPSLDTIVFLYLQTDPVYTQPWHSLSCVRSALYYRHAPLYSATASAGAISVPCSATALCITNPVRCVSSTPLLLLQAIQVGSSTALCISHLYVSSTPLPLVQARLVPWVALPCVSVTLCTVLCIQNSATASEALWVPLVALLPYTRYQ